MQPRFWPSWLQLILEGNTCFPNQAWGVWVRPRSLSRLLGLLASMFLRLCWTRLLPSPYPWCACRPCGSSVYESLVLWTMGNSNWIRQGHRSIRCAVRKNRKQKVTIS